MDRIDICDLLTSITYGLQTLLGDGIMVIEILISVCHALIFRRMIVVLSCTRRLGRRSETIFRAAAVLFG
jgi:hypothetical protein